MEQIWYTLAVSSIGTHKMRFRDKMTKEKAKKIGKDYCRMKDMAYGGTFSEHEIDIKEAAIREIIYED